MDWWKAIAWERRVPEFRELFVHQAERPLPMMTFLPDRVTDAWRELGAVWAALPRHPALLEPVGMLDDGTLALFYAALLWERYRPADAVILRWAAQIALAFEHIATHVPPAQHWLFTRPDVHVDLGLFVRIGFLPPDADLGRAVSLPDVANLVCELLADDLVGTSERAILRQRYATFAELLQAVEREVRVRPSYVREGTRRVAWELTEQGIGLLYLERHRDALDALEVANRMRSTHLTRWLINQCRPKLGMRPFGPWGRVPPQPPSWEAAPRKPWRESRAQIEALEAERDFAAAIIGYDQVLPMPSEEAEVYIRRARCHLHLGQSSPAIEFARKAIAIDIARFDARATLVRALIEHRAYAEALAEADTYVARATHDGTAHYLRAKALLALRRLAEARDAFDLAIALKPTMLEALLLRRETDRMLGTLGHAVGQQHVTIAIPDSLENLRDILTSGRSRAAIEALSAPSLADDPDAQLLLARFHGFDGNHDAALAIYDRWLDSPQRLTALVGKAGTLLAQGHLDSALALFDAVLAERPSDVDAIEGRARALDQLGRTDEAAAEFRRFVNQSSAGAPLRARAAQLWLDHH